MYQFTHKTALVTGAGQGIGKAIAQAFSHHQANVVLADQDEEAGRETLDWLIKKGAPAESLLFVPCNVAEEEQVIKLVQATIDHFGRLDFLINNAGLSKFTPFDELTVAAWDEVLGVNLRGAFMCALYAAPYLKQSQKGVIINITSTRAHQSEKESEAYAASKGGLLSLTHALAVSLGPQVRVNAISPGWIEVSHWKKQATRKEVSHNDQERNQHPAGRVGEPEDIGRAVVFLCSGEAGFITGQELIIDGGMSKRMIYEA